MPKPSGGFIHQVASRAGVLVLAALLFVGCKSDNIILAARKGNLEGVKKAIDRGEDVNTTLKKNLPECPDCQGATALQAAVRAEKVEIVRYLVTNKNLNLQKKTVQAALITAAWQGSHEIVKLLLSTGINPNYTALWTPLTAAARSGSLQTVKLLIEAGAKPTTAIEASGNQWYTPLRLARENNLKEMFDYLVEQGGATKATANDTAVLRKAPDKDAERASCMTWTKMCDTGPCGETSTSVLSAGQTAYINGRSEKKMRVGKWNNFWYQISLADWTCGADTWVYGEFLTIEE